MQRELKQKIAFVIFVAGVLTACKRSEPSAPDEGREAKIVAPARVETKEPTPEYNTLEALAYGLRGHVQSVEATSYNTYDNNGTLEESGVNSQYSIAFDAWGHIVHDEWGNVYEYDTEGSFYRGNHVYTTVKRDEKGRVISYKDASDGEDDESNATYSFSYDKAGRLAKIAIAGWTGTYEESRSYKGNTRHPSSIAWNSTDEGGGMEEGNTTYRYSRFDETGNWIERTCVASTTTHTEVLVNDSVSDKITVSEQITVERRVISYFNL